jgi:aspartyl-tRNA(Asn)/glutamyl-tRNA(Gln) amidotransferase subunit C
MGDKSHIDIGYVAGLARIDIDPESQERLQKDMEDIVEFIEQLKELDVEGIEPTAHAVPLTNVWREDVAGQSFPRENMLANAPAAIDEEQIKVPQVLPGEGMS